MTLTPQWVFFDAVGTLFHVRGAVGPIYAQRAARYGVHADAAQLEHDFRDAFRTAPPPLFPGAPAGALPELERAWWRSVVAQAFGRQPEFAAGNFERFFDDVFAHFAGAEPWQPYPGAAAALAGLQAAGMHLGVVSDMDGRLPGVLAALGLAPFFELVVLAARCGTTKASGGPFRHALQAAGVPGGAAVHVGDRLDADVDGARAAGMRAVWFRPDEAAGAGAPPIPSGVPVLRRLSELPAVLRETPA